jgi:hypothetical protein
LCIPPEDGQQGPKHVAAKIYKIQNKHFEELLRGMVLLTTLIKYMQQDAEPQNKNYSYILHFRTVLIKSVEQL